MGYLPPSGRHPGDDQRPGGRTQQPAAQQLHDGPALHVVASTTSPTTSTRRGTTARPARSSTSCTSARPCSTWSTSRSTSRRSTRATPSGPTARCRASPPNSFVSAEVQDNPYPYNPAKAIVAAEEPRLEGRAQRDVAPVSRPAPGANQCGAGIPPGAKLAFNLQYASGTAATTQMMAAEKSSWAAAGINIDPVPGVVQHGDRQRRPVLGVVVLVAAGELGRRLDLLARTTTRPGRRSSRPGPGPTRAATRIPTNDANILATNVTQAPLTQYENYLAEQLPVVCQPNPVDQPDRDRQGPHRRHPAEPVLDDHPGELAVHG